MRTHPPASNAAEGYRIRSHPPVVVVLAARWWGDGEEEWFTRQVASSWVEGAQVDVFTLQGAEESSAGGRTALVNGNGVGCTVHPLGLTPDPRTMARRDWLFTALSTVAAATGEPGSLAVEQLLARGTVEAWAVVDEAVAALHPDLVVVVGYRNLGAFEVWQRVAPGTPLVFVPLADSAFRAGLNYVEVILDRAAATLVATELEYQAVIGPLRPALRRRKGVHRIGLPAGGEVPDHGGPTDEATGRAGIVILTGTPLDGYDQPAAWARLVALAFPHTRVTVVGTDALDVWSRGVPARSAAPRRESEIIQMMAGAAVTVHLRPGLLLARWCINSMLSGTPVLVPADSRGRQLTESGGAGLWYSSLAELIWCLDALLDPAVSSRFGAQGKRFAQTESGSKAAFVDRVHMAIGGRLVLANR